MYSHGWDWALRGSLLLLVIGVGIALHAKLRSWWDLRTRIDARHGGGVMAGPIERPGDLANAVMRAYGLPGTFAAMSVQIEDDFTSTGPTLTIRHLMRPGEMEAIARELEAVRAEPRFTIHAPPTAPPLSEFGGPRSESGSGSA